ncbi:hypothetical protein LDL08_31290 [Nonomuraea glycinis]|uniref:hypothetical protein n=1 Tax=Nonomuraea glycinis TaxID=2047744 RepID=UPI001666ACF4|nr:hypothetical protein [Nonomuraea glycinis]MCA2180672.1 hypothetical protein [Nonomuraea glycinis]
MESIVTDSTIIDYLVPVNARLLLAQCAVVNGDIDGGADMAAAVLQDLGVRRKRPQSRPSRVGHDGAAG